MGVSHACLWEKIRQIIKVAEQIAIIVLATLDRLTDEKAWHKIADLRMVADAKVRNSCINISIAIIMLTTMLTRENEWLSEE